MGAAPIILSHGNTLFNLTEFFILFPKIRVAHILYQAEPPLFSAELNLYRRIEAVGIGSKEMVLHSVLKLNLCLCRILHEKLRMGSVKNGGLYPFHIGRDNIANPVDAVNGLIDNRSASLIFPGPLPVTPRIIRIRSVPGQNRTCRKEFSVNSLFQASL